MRGEVENEGLAKIRIDTADIELVDKKGRRVDGVATFAPGYLHSLYAANRRPKGGIPEEERLRIGLVAEVQPGKSASLTVSWHERRDRTPVRVDYGPGSLPVPRER